MSCGSTAREALAAEVYYKINRSNSTDRNERVKSQTVGMMYILIMLYLPTYLVYINSGTIYIYTRIHLRELHIVAEHHSHYVARCLTWKACYCRLRYVLSFAQRIIHRLYVWVPAFGWCTRSCKCNQQTEKDKRIRFGLVLCCYSVLRTATRRWWWWWLWIY